MSEKIYPEMIRPMNRILRAKERRRRFLARLPIQQKVEVIVQMQRMTNDIRRKSGRPPLPEWRI